ncbi:hypothetical protein EC988_004013, partial [Linderina pennispora]
MDCKETLLRCGVELRDGEPPLVHTSTALFRYKLGEAIATDPTLASTLANYIEELLSDHDHISLYLEPASVTAASDGTAVQRHGGSAQSESLVQLLLGIDALQSQLITTLLDKFPEFIGDDDGNTDNASDTKVSVRLLRQLRWLDYVIDSAALTAKLIETLGFVPPEMQSEIIVALPDIISDSDHADVSKVLVSMLRDAPTLMLPILETLGSLECSLNQQQECRNAVLMHMISAEPGELPVMVKYLLQSVSAETAPATIQRIRRRLDMDSVVLTMRQMGKVSEDLAPDVLIFDVIATSLKSHRHLREAWLKVIATDCEQVGTQTTLDIVVLLILHEITALSKRVETVLRAKINLVSSHPVAYTPDIMGAAVRRFPTVFAAHFSGLLSVTSWLIQTSPLNSFSSQVVAAMTVAAFGGMGTFQRQEIAAELAAHVGSGNANEVDTAARIYLQLAQQHPMELRPFAVFIKGLLDYVDNLSIENMRMVFDTLGILATLNTSGGDDSMFSDLYIFVRKQLASAFPKYNRIGIVGTVSLLRQLGTKDNNVHMSRALNAGIEGGSSSQLPTANVQALRKAVQLLEMLVDAGRHQSWAFVSMTYDELAHIVEVHGLHPQLMTWLHENVSSAFASMFLADKDMLGARYILYGQPQVSLPLDEDDATVLDILAHNKDAADLGMMDVARREDSESECGGNAATKLRGCQLACLPSLFRLIQVCEKALSNGSLAE